jgi:legumain
MPTGGYLYADELMKAFQFMYDNKMYKELVFYMEACESGSMFEKLPKNINIYALSAANAHESSWGTYCSPDDKVDGKSIGSCLGDLFSVNWMEDLDKAMKDKQMGIETLSTQYDTVKTKTAKSHVLQWGDLTIDAEVIGEFEAATFKEPKNAWSALKSMGKSFLKEQVGWNDYHTAQKNDFAVDVRDIDMHYLYTKVAQDPSEENQKALMDELNNRLATDKRFEQLFPQFFQQVKDKTWPSLELDQYDCYRNLIDLYNENCGEADTYAMKYFGNFVHQCQAIKYYAGAENDFKTKLADVCPKTA